MEGVHFHNLRIFSLRQCGGYGSGRKDDLNGLLGPRGLENVPEIFFSTDVTLADRDYEKIVLRFPRISKVESGAVVARAGVRPGDLLLAVNGERLDEGRMLGSDGKGLSESQFQTLLARRPLSLVFAEEAQEFEDAGLFAKRRGRMLRAAEVGGLSGGDEDDDGFPGRARKSVAGFRLPGGLVPAKGAGGLLAGGPTKPGGTGRNVRGLLSGLGAARMFKGSGRGAAAVMRRGEKTETIKKASLKPAGLQIPAPKAIGTEQIPDADGNLVAATVMDNGSLQDDKGTILARVEKDGTIVSAFSGQPIVDDIGQPRSVSENVAQTIATAEANREEIREKILEKIDVPKPKPVGTETLPDADGLFNITATVMDDGSIRDEDGVILARVEKDGTIVSSMTGKPVLDENNKPKKVEQQTVWKIAAAEEQREAMRREALEAAVLAPAEHDEKAVPSSSPHPGAAALDPRNAAPPEPPDHELIAHQALADSGLFQPLDPDDPDSPILGPSQRAFASRYEMADEPDENGDPVYLDLETGELVGSYEYMELEQQATEEDALLQDQIMGDAIQEAEAEYAETMRIIAIEGRIAEGEGRLAGELKELELFVRRTVMEDASRAAAAGPLGRGDVGTLGELVESGRVMMQILIRRTEQLELRFRRRHLRRLRSRRGGRAELRRLRKRDRNLNVGENRLVQAFGQALGRTLGPYAAKLAAQSGVGASNSVPTPQNFGKALAKNKGRGGFTTRKPKTKPIVKPKPKTQPPPGTTSTQEPFSAAYAAESIAFNRRLEQLIEEGLVYMSRTVVSAEHHQFALQNSLSQLTRLQEENLKFARVSQQKLMQEQPREMVKVLLEEQKTFIEENKIKPHKTSEVYFDRMAQYLRLSADVSEMKDDDVSSLGLDEDILHVGDPAMPRLKRVVLSPGTGAAGTAGEDVPRRGKWSPGQAQDTGIEGDDMPPLVPIPFNAPGAKWSQTETIVERGGQARSRSGSPTSARRARDSPPQHPRLELASLPSMTAVMDIPHSPLSKLMEREFKNAGKSLRNALRDAAVDPQAVQTEAEAEAQDLEAKKQREQAMKKAQEARYGSG